MDLTNAEALKKIREHIEKGTYRLGKHSIEQSHKRTVTLPEVLRVLQWGRIEGDKIGWNIRRQGYKFAIFGRTLSMVIVEIKEMELFVISVITPGKPDKSNKKGKKR